jgi:hypothetical protein
VSDEPEIIIVDEPVDLLPDDAMARWIEDRQTYMQRKRYVLGGDHLKKSP